MKQEPNAILEESQMGKFRTNGEQPGSAWLTRLKGLFFRENSPALTYVDKQIIDELVRRPQTATGLIKSLVGKVSRRTAFIHLEVLEKSGIVKKKGDYYYGGPIVELEARNTLLGLISIVALFFGILTNNVALMMFSILGLAFASNRKIRYERRPKTVKKRAGKSVHT